MITKRLVRTYYEKHYTFKGIEKTAYFNQIENKAKALNQSVEDYCIGCLGVGIERERLDFAINDLDDKYKDYVKLISNYFKYCNSIKVIIEDHAVPVKEVMETLRLCAGTKSHRSILSSPVAKDILKLAPKWKLVEIENPTITLGKLYYNDKNLDAKKRTEIEKRGFEDAVFNAETVPLSVQDEISKIMKYDNVYISEKKISNYEKLLNICYTLNKPVKEVLNACGFNYIDTEDQFLKYNCSVRAHNDKAVRVIGIGSVSDKDTVILPNNEFKALYENGILQTLRWENGVAMIQDQTVKPLAKLYNRSNSVHDLR